MSSRTCASTHTHPTRRSLAPEAGGTALSRTHRCRRACWTEPSPHVVDANIRCCSFFCYVRLGVLVPNVTTCVRHHATADLAPEPFTKRVRWVSDGRVVCLLAVVPVAVPPDGRQLRRLVFVCHVPPSAVPGMQPLCKASQPAHGVMFMSTLCTLQRLCTSHSQQICAHAHA